jgi:hypothetical protein
MPFTNSPAPSTSTASTKFGISPNECGCTECKRQTPSSITFGEMPSLDDDDNKSCDGHLRVEMLESNRCRQRVFRKSVRTLSQPVLRFIAEEGELQSSARYDEMPSESLSEMLFDSAYDSIQASHFSDSLLPNLLNGPSPPVQRRCTLDRPMDSNTTTASRSTNHRTTIALCRHRPPTLPKLT